MKFVNCLILVILFVFPTIAMGANPVNIKAQWAYNGQDDETRKGFKFYLDGEVIIDVPDPAAREATQTIDLENGDHIFTMAAYGDDWESTHSLPYKFEYLHVDITPEDHPAPTVLIQIN